MRRGIFMAPAAGWLSAGSASATATDNFSRGGGTQNPITSPMSDGVSTWINQTGSPTAPVVPQIITGQAYSSVAATNSIGIVNTPTFTSDQNSSVTLGGTTAFIGPIVRVQGTATNYSYYVARNDGNSTTILLRETAYTAGVASSTTLQTINGLSLAVGSVIKLEATGSNPVALKVFVNGAQVGSTYNDSVFLLTGGQPGFINSANNVSLTAFTASNG